MSRTRSEEPSARLFSSVGDACGWIEACYDDAGAPIAPAREVARAIEGMRQPR